MVMRDAARQLNEHVTCLYLILCGVHQHVFRC